MRDTMFLLFNGDGEPFAGAETKKKAEEVASAMSDDYEKKYGFALTIDVSCGPFPFWQNDRAIDPHDFEEEKA